MKKFLLSYGAYILRWQLFTPILVFVVGFTTKKMGLGFWAGAAIANLIGALIFFWVDRLIYRKPKNDADLNLTLLTKKAA